MSAEVQRIQEMTAARERSCRRCGCTDENACIERDPLFILRGCYWVEPDLCSRCEVEMYPRMEDEPDELDSS